jgi:hypothetical protein
MIESSTEGQSGVASGGNAPARAAVSQWNLARLELRCTALGEPPARKLQSLSVPIEETAELVQQAGGPGTAVQCRFSCWWRALSASKAT